MSRPVADDGARLGALPVALAVASALALWFAGRMELNAWWGLPWLSPGLGPFLLLLAAAALACGEGPRLRPGGGRTLLMWLAGAALLGLGQA
ncbi:MAG TPA: hypothetical protein VNZ67_09630, partial [bacterium]|nr:hypothetical protein [bacterium]